MRTHNLPFAPLALLACCSPSTSPAPAPTPAGTPIAVPTRPSRAAQAAVEVAQDYFDALKARRWKQAHALWRPEVIGPLPAFAVVSAKATAFSGLAGAPSAISMNGGTQFILVEAVTDTADARHGSVKRHGVVMLKRPVGEAQPWRIWGTDIRVRHCRAGEQPRGLGCIPA